MKKQWWLLVVFSLLLVGSVSAQYYRPGSFMPYSANFSDTINGILDWFVDNPGFVDAIVLLVIFLVLGKSVFKDYFGSKTLYIVIAISLTLGVLLWERQTGISLILNSGPAGILLLLVAGFYFFFYIIHGFTGQVYLSVAIAYIIFYNYLTYILNYAPEYIPDWLYRIAEFLIFGYGDLLTVVLLVMLVVAVISFIRAIRGRWGRDQGQRSQPGVR